MKYFWVLYLYTKACFCRSHSTYEGVITLSIWKVLLHWFYRELLIVSKVSMLLNAFCYLVIPFFSLLPLPSATALPHIFPNFALLQKEMSIKSGVSLPNFNNFVNRLLMWRAGHLTCMMTCFSMAIDSVSEQLKPLLKRSSHEGDKERSMPLKGQRLNSDQELFLKRSATPVAGRLEFQHSRTPIIKAKDSSVM